MLDIKDKKGNVVAVLMDDGQIIKKDKPTDDIDALVKAALKNKKG